MTELKQISFSLFKHIYERLGTYCDKTGQNITAILRQAVYEFLDKTVPASSPWATYPWYTTDSYERLCGCDATPPVPCGCVITPTEQSTTTKDEYGNEITSQ